MKIQVSVVVLLLGLLSCEAQQTPPAEKKPIASLRTGAERMEAYIPAIKGKNIALLVNQTSIVGNVHLVDTLLSSGIKIKRIFAPEHGFRGSADAGEHIEDGKDAKTGLKVISLYGDKKKPSNEDLKDVEVLVFDIQDVGARFYTFISSLHYLMEACAEKNIDLMVLDRPNPNGWYVDGPLLERKFQSFVGVDAIPVVHGLTVGEYAQMVNGEGWLKDGMRCKLTVISCDNYSHKMRYSLPVKPSPNLPNDLAVYLYPSLCYFEGTDVSVGRGTNYPFQLFGSPNFAVRNFSFVPKSMEGAKNPPHMNKVCFGVDLHRSGYSAPGIQLNHLLYAFKNFSDTSKFFLHNNFFDKLWGTDKVRKMIVEGKSEEYIKLSWQSELQLYKKLRKKYLLYPDFE
ncbi:MAG: DUF1343 domain-containing protein [Bacteroidetes bacterium]|nr:DUF1343 domain-containing protein [Bacteroidota bacterium]